jgi:polyferredoxin
VPPRVDKVLKYGKYIMLALLVLFPLAFETQLFRLIGPFRVIFNLDGEYYAVAFLCLVLLSSVFIERAYCRYFCPEGGLLALAQLVSPYRMRLDRNKCTCCRRCYRICPVDAFVVEGKAPVSISRTECIVCKECEAVCRDGSLSFGFKLKSSDQEPTAGACSEEDNDEGRVSP